jgi:outer membrane receptor protein involved in Fe transport
MRATDFGRKAVLPHAVLLALGVTAAGPQAMAQDDEDEDLVEERIIVTGSRIVRRDFTSQSPIVTIEAETFTERANIGLEATLNQLPQFNTAGTQATSSPASTPFPSASAAPGAATIDLRGLGLNRSLILLDGRRVQPVNGQLVVDLNTIPAAAIERVEIITGGAAAVYGADAIAGVVNFILKDDFEGLEFSTQYGITEEGDGEEMSVSGLFGADFSDGRGNILLGANYSRREIIYGRDRDWIVAGWNDPNTAAGGLGQSNLSSLGAATTNYIDQNGNVFDSANPLDLARPYTGPLGGDSGFKINPNGSLGYNDFANNRLQLPLDRYAIFGSGRYELTDNVELFTNLRFSETYAVAQGFVSNLFNIWSPTVPYSPEFDDPDSPDFGMGGPDFAHHPVSAPFADVLNARATPDAPWTYQGGMDYIPVFRTETTSNVYQVIGGLRGDIDVGRHNWTWEAYASHGKTSVNAHQPEGFPYLPRVQNLFNADQYGEGFDNLNLPGAVPIAITGTCTSGLPIFNADGSVDNTPSISKDCADYIVLRMNSVTTLTQDVVEGSFSGSLAEMPAGELQFALGTAYREENFAFDPDSGFNANQDFANVVQNIILPVTVEGSTDVTEIFGELAIPLVRDRKFVQSFELDPGFRYSDYNTVGVENTYKVMFDWTVNDTVRFRGGKQVATRAPNVTELFTPRGGSELTGGNDACAFYLIETPTWGNRPENPDRFNLQTLCQELMVREGAPSTLYEPGGSADTYSYNVFGGETFFPLSIGVTEGNPNLLSESADTFTFGVVLSFERVSVAVDWYKIEIEEAIDTPGHDTIYQQCLSAEFNPLIGSAPGTYTGAELAAANPFCALIQREYVGGFPPDPGSFGADRKFSAQFLNQGGLISEGYDVQVNWSTDIGSSGVLNLNVVASILDEFSESPFPGSSFQDFTGTTQNSSFDWLAFTSINYSQGFWSIGLRWEHMPALNRAPSETEANFGVKSHDQFDMFSSWSFNDNYELRFGVDNLLNEDPAIVGASTADANLGSTNSDYDPFGRRYYVGLSVSF